VLSFLFCLLSLRIHDERARCSLFVLVNIYKLLYCYTVTILLYEYTETDVLFIVSEGQYGT
jgi:hypothetical protein